MQRRDTVFTCQKQVHEVQCNKVLLIHCFRTLYTEMKTDLISQISLNQACLNFSKGFLKFCTNCSKVLNCFCFISFFIIRKRVIEYEEEVENWITILEPFCMFKQLFKLYESRSIRWLNLIENDCKFWRAEITWNDKRSCLIFLEVRLNFFTPVHSCYTDEFSFYFFWGVVIFLVIIVLRLSMYIFLSSSLIDEIL